MFLFFYFVCCISYAFWLYFQRVCLFLFFLWQQCSFCSSQNVSLRTLSLFLSICVRFLSDSGLINVRFLLQFRQLISSSFFSPCLISTDLIFQPFFFPLFLLSFLTSPCTVPPTSLPYFLSLHCLFTLSIFSFSLSPQPVLVSPQSSRVLIERGQHKSTFFLFSVLVPKHYPSDCL